MGLGWTDSYEPPRPKVLSARSFGIALALHLAVFAVFFIVAKAQGLFVRKETVIPIDLTVIVNENLDGVENEPPPVLNPPKPEPPKPKAKAKKAKKPKPKEPEPPKPLEQIVTNVVTKVEKKDDKEKDKGRDKDKEKKPAEKKTAAPKKTAAELRKERLERIRKNAKVTNSKAVRIEVPNATKSGNGRTARQTLTDAQIRNLLNQGYRPGTQNQIATDEKQRCLSLIQMAIEDRWDKMMPKVGRDGTVLLSVQFNSAGGLVNVRLQRSCGDALSDQAALAVARSVTSIRGLSAEFLSEFRKTPLTIRYRVEGR